jgi:phosphoglycerate kinase
MLKKNPKRPFTAILGGGKIKDKIPLIQNLLHTVDTLIIYPALCFSFLQAMNKSIGKSLVDTALTSTCKAIICNSQNSEVTIKFPLDYQIAYNSIDGPLALIDGDIFPDNAVGISIGPKTITQCTNIINESNTIFFNCAMGFSNRSETLQSTQEIIHAMAQSSATTIIAGGNSVDRALSTPDHSLITHLSSGGGASLACLGNAVLPGLAPFEQQ